MSLPARFIGVITSPKETFQSVVAHPKWLGMLVLTTLLAAFCVALPSMTEAGKEAWLTTQVEARESFGQPMSDQEYEGVRRMMPYVPFINAGFVLVVGPLMAVVFTAILFAVFNVALGGEASFRQMFAVYVHAGAIMTLQQLFTGPLNYVRGAVSSATNLAVLLPVLDEKSFAGRFLAAIDLFLLWYVMVLAIGLAVLYRRRTQPIAITLYGVYAVIALIIAAVMSGLGGA